MKSPNTIRVELKRLRGMRSRAGLTAEQRALLVRDTLTLEWVLAGGSPRWRPSERHPGLRVRKGDR